MPKLKSLSTKDIIKILKKFGFKKVSQKGSHIKLVRYFESEKEILVIPNSKELPKGTTKAIFDQSCKFILRKELKQYFYLKN